MSESNQSYVNRILESNKQLATKTLEKTQEIAEKSVDKTQEIAEKTVDINRDIWLAGLGAFADVRTEGQQAFEKLVVRGEQFETSTRTRLEEQTASVKVNITRAFDKVSDAAKTVSDKVANQNLQTLFDCPLSQAIKNLSTPAVELIDTVTLQLKDIAARLNGVVEESVEVVADTVGKVEKTA